MGSVGGEKVGTGRDGNPLTRALVVATVVAVGVAVYSLVVNLTLQSEMAALQQELSTAQGVYEGSATATEALEAELAALQDEVRTQAARCGECVARVEQLEVLTSPLNQIVGFLRATFPASGI